MNRSVSVYSYAMTPNCLPACTCIFSLISLVNRHEFVEICINKDVQI